MPHEIGPTVPATVGAFLTALMGLLGAVWGIRWQTARSKLAVAQAGLVKAETFTEYITAVDQAWALATAAKAEAESATARAAGAQITTSEFREALAACKAQGEENDKRWSLAEQVLRECADGVPHLREAVIALRVSLMNGGTDLRTTVEDAVPLDPPDPPPINGGSATKKKRGHKGRGRKI